MPQPRNRRKAVSRETTSSGFCSSSTVSTPLIPVPNIANTTTSTDEPPSLLHKAIPIYITGLLAIIFRFTNYGHQYIAFYVFFALQGQPEYAMILTALLLQLASVLLKIPRFRNIFQPLHYVLAGAFSSIIVVLAVKLFTSVAFHPIVAHDILTPHESMALIKQVDEFAAVHGWTSKRHVAFPTQDIPLKEFQEFDNVMLMLEQRLYPKMNQFSGFNSRVDPKDVFIIRYSTDVQPGLLPHMDAGHLTANLLLSHPNDFQGGGTHYEFLNKTFTLQQGQALLTPAYMWHQGHNITQGLRYILIIFSETLPPKFENSPFEFVAIHALNFWRFLNKCSTAMAHI